MRSKKVRRKRRVSKGELATTAGVRRKKPANGRRKRKIRAGNRRVAERIAGETATRADRLTSARLRRTRRSEPETHRIAHDEVWVTREGQRIEVQDLTESHAKNIVRMILRKQRLDRDAAQLDAGIQAEYRQRRRDDPLFPDHIRWGLDFGTED